MPKRVPFQPLNRMRELRDARGITLRELAEAIGTNAAVLSRFERGTRDLGFEWMKRIARVLEVPPADLLLPADGGLDPRAREVADVLAEVPASHRSAIYAVAESLQPFRAQGEVHDIDGRLRPLKKAPEP